MSTEKEKAFARRFAWILLREKIAECPQIPEGVSAAEIDAIIGILFPAFFPRINKKGKP